MEIRRPTGGDPNRKAPNLHHGVLVSDAFMRAVENDEEWGLVSPKDQSPVRKISARSLWIRLLTARVIFFLFLSLLNSLIYIFILNN